MEGIGIALDVAGDRMFVTDFAGSVYSAKLDGSESETFSMPKAISPASPTRKSKIRSKENQPCQNKPIRRVAIIGTGVIGASWTALFLAKGLEVVATDIAPDAEAALRTFVKAAWPALERLGLAPGASQSRLTFTAELRGSGRRRGLRPGERARADRLQEEAVSAARRAVAGRRDHRVELVGPHHERNSIGLPLCIPSAASSAIRSIRRTWSRWSRSSAARRPRKRPSSAPRNSTRDWGSRRSGCARKCRGTSPTACRRRWRAKSTISSPRMSSAPRTSIPRCAGARPALGHHGQHDAQPPRRRPRRHRALLPAVHRPDDGLVEDARRAGIDARSAKEAHRQRSCRGRLALDRRAGGAARRGLWGCSSCAPRPRKRLRVPQSGCPRRLKGRRAFPAPKRNSHASCKGDPMTAALEETRPRETLPRPEASASETEARRDHWRRLCRDRGGAGVETMRCGGRSDRSAQSSHLSAAALPGGDRGSRARRDRRPIRQIEEKQKNLTVMLAEVTAVDLSSRSVTCPTRRPGLIRSHSIS